MNSTLLFSATDCHLQLKIPACYWYLDWCA